MPINERLVEFTNLFSAKNFKKNDEIILEYFQQFDNWTKKKNDWLQTKKGVYEFITNINEKNIL